MIYALVLFIASQIGDAVSTWKALQGTGLKEGNPISAKLMERFGVNGWVVIKTGIMAGVGYLLFTNGQEFWLWAIGGGTGLVVVNNVRLIRRTNK